MPAHSAASLCGHCDPINRPPFGGARNGLLIPAYRPRTDFPVRSPSKEQEVHAVPYLLSPAFVPRRPDVRNIAGYAPLGSDGGHHARRSGAVRLWRSQKRRLLEAIEVMQKRKAPRRSPRGLLLLSEKIRLSSRSRLRRHRRERPSSSRTSRRPGSQSSGSWRRSTPRSVARSGSPSPGPRRRRRSYRRTLRSAR